MIAQTHLPGCSVADFCQKDARQAVKHKGLVPLLAVPASDLLRGRRVEESRVQTDDTLDRTRSEDWQCAHSVPAIPGGCYITRGALLNQQKNPQHTYRKIIRLYVRLACLET